jgi:CRISPR-associated endonuclease/helicase Cas3
MTSTGTAFRELFLRATGVKPYPYQVRLATAPDLAAVLDAATGAGKTRAVLLTWLFRRLFAGAEMTAATPLRLVYALPMRVLVEQTWGEVGTVLERLELGPERVARHLLMGGETDDDWVRTPAQPAVLVGTVDMLLSRALNRGYAQSRFRWPIDFGLLNADCLWVLDETQLMGVASVTAAQLQGLRRRLGSWRPSRTLWMSATVDQGMLRTPDHPAVDGVLRLGQEDDAGELGRRMHAPKRLRRAADTPADIVLVEHQPGALSLVVLNTVDRAVGAYRKLRRRPPPGAELLLLHSRFRLPDRRRLADRLKAPLPPAGRVVCATQVVEAGVDTSARLLVTEAAPWSSIVQRLGRCNRYAEHPVGEARWVDVASAAPYTKPELAAARALLERLEDVDVSPASLADIGRPDPERTPLPMLRQRDLLDLFDTAPDLSGNDVDVSRFIREREDVDCVAFWRAWEGTGPPAELGQPARDELCPVPVGELRKFVVKREGWAWDALDGRWRRLRDRDVRPGLMALLPASGGGYSPEIGWDPASRQFVEPVQLAAGLEPDANRADPASYGRWITLTQHTRDVVERAIMLWRQAVPETPPEAAEALRWAATAHDLGKAHPRFQSWLLRCEEEGSVRRETFWAKSVCTGRPAKDHPRHELASALALLLSGVLMERLEPPWDDLALHLIAAHHARPGSRLGPGPMTNLARPF